MLSRQARLLGLALSGTLALSACGSDGDETAGPSTSGGPGGVNCATGSITAAGSSAQKNAMDEWIKAYQTACSGSTINYQAVGSGAGREQLIAGTVDFAGSDSALKEEQVEQVATRCGGGAGLNLPMVVGPIALAYNLPGVDGLVLDAATIAKVFTGKITTWDDAAIKALNSGKSLPSTRIQPFSRSDESGTTDNFQKYLDAAAPAEWTVGAGQKFAGSGTQGAAKSDGVTQGVKSTKGAITYVEVSFAENAGLSVAQIDTGSGPVELTGDSAAKALEAATIEGTGNDLKLTLDYATKAAGAYPIVLVTYEIACEKGTDAAKLPLVKAFLAYTASTDGQGILEDLGYAPLPESIRAKVATAVDSLA